MDVYLANADVTITVPFQDRNGNPVSPTSATYRVISEDNSELVTPTVVSVANGAPDVEITVLSAVNDLGAALKGLRTIELTMVTNTGSVVVNHRYIVEAPSILEFGVNSFQTYNQALLTSTYMVDVDLWKAATESEQRSAMMEAYVNLMRLNYSSTDQPLQEMTVVELQAIDATLLTALGKAQVAEADFLLGGESVGDKRRYGLLAESIGESSQMYRSGKPLKLPVSEKAIGYLSGLISWSVGIRR